MAKFCTNCGAPLKENAKFCGNCGNVVANKADPAEPAQKPDEVAQVPPDPAPGPVDPVQGHQASFVNGTPVPPQPPVGGNMYTAPAKKKKTGLIVGLIIGTVVLLIAAGVLMYFLIGPGAKKDAEPTTAPVVTPTVAPATQAPTSAAPTEKPMSDDPFGGEDNIELKVYAPDNAVAETRLLCAQFLAEHFDKKISISVLPMGEADAATAVLADPESEADVFGIASDMMIKLYDADAVAEVADPEEVSRRNIRGSVDACTIDGHLYAYPMTADNGYFLVYDKSVVSDEDAKTLEGVLKACRKSNKKMIIDTGNGYYAAMFAFTGGLSLDGIDSSGNQKYNNYDEDEVLDTLYAFSDLLHEYNDVIVSKDTVAISAGFKDGTVAAGIDGNWNTAANKKALGDNFGASKLPTINVNGVDRQIISMHGYKMMCVNSRSKFPNSAQLLADYLTNEQSQIKRAEELSWGPSNVSAMGNSAVTNDIGIKAALEQANYSVSMKEVSPAFWAPMGSLGSALIKTQDKAEIKKAFDNLF